jgi:acetyl esterase/lipase
MPSKEFLAFQSNIPTAPPTGDTPGFDPGGPVQGGPNNYPGADLGVPMFPKDYVAPEPEIPEGCTGGKMEVNGVTGLHITMDGVRSKAALLYLHGGGFTIGSAMTAGPLLKLFAEKCGLEGYGVEYGLAPWHPFPQGLNDCVRFYEGLLDMGYEEIVVGGESAGAALTLSLALAVKEKGLKLPKVLWCSSPVDDVEWYKGEVYHQDFLSESSDKVQLAYAPDADPKDPLLSPIYGDFTGMPPMIIQTGGGESLSAGGVRLAAKAAKANVEVVLHFGQDMPHTFAMDYRSYPEAAQAMEEILTFVNNRLAIS